MNNYVYHVNLKGSKGYFISIFCDSIDTKQLRYQSKERFISFIKDDSIICIVPFDLVNLIYLNDSDDPIDLYNL